MWTAGNFPPFIIGQAEISFLRLQNAIILRAFHLHCTGYRELLVCGLYYRKFIGRSVLPENKNTPYLKWTSNLKMRPKYTEVPSQSNFKIITEPTCSSPLRQKCSSELLPYTHLYLYFHISCTCFHQYTRFVGGDYLIMRAACPAYQNV